MNDEPKISDPPQITDPHLVPVVFVNEVLGTGFVNGVVNITLGTMQFTPSLSDNEVDPDWVISARLRMDMYCAQRLRDSLDAIIQKNTRPAGATEH
jgi:hypothetical protein